jgi:hypothetical protein
MSSSAEMDEWGREPASSGFNPKEKKKKKGRKEGD